MTSSVEEDLTGECTDENQDTSVEELIAPESPDVNNIFGDPKVLPRVGDQYQVQIPSLVAELDLRLFKNLTDQDYVVDTSHSFQMGLHIPIMWINERPDSSKKELVASKQSNINLKNGDSEVRIEPLDFASDSGRGFGGLTSCELAETGIGNSVQKPEAEKLKDQGYCLAPGSLSNSWSDLEQESFLLGLYIFEKNLVLLKEFIGSKEMGDILSYYYGIFYRSDRYRRWSECRKIRSRKCIYGHRIFTGWRQQELLSRLLARVSEECQTTLLEVSRRFGDGKIYLEEYVSTLKAKVGMNLLIEAVGIGKGKQDLTGFVMERPKVNQVIHPRLEVPVGSACSSLSYGEIIRFLTGDFRLSKARATDLFYESVWPRLTANGWNSEAPKNRGYAHSKNNYVFLVPGIKKFSRRRLEKGSHYFDCISDVLNKVASEPRLIELPTDPHRRTQGDEEFEGNTKVELEEDSHFGHQRHRFLQPPVSNSKSDRVKFTVVDTTVVPGEPETVIKLRSLPVKTIKGSPPIISRKDDNENRKDPVDRLDSNASNDHMDTESSLPQKHMSDLASPNGSEPTNDRIDCSEDGNGVMLEKYADNIMTCKSSPVNDPEYTNVPMDSKRDGNTTMPEKSLSKEIKCQFSRRRKHGQANNLAPVTKRRRLTACSHDDAIRSTNNSCIVPEVKEKEHHLRLGSGNGSVSMVSEASSSHSKVSTSSSANSSLNERTKDGLGESCFDDSAPSEKRSPRTLIDLNLPHPSSAFETSQKCVTNMQIRQGDQSPDAHGLDDTTKEQRPVTSGRRQSTRNRPLTTKALEALECGFLTRNCKWTGMEPIPEENYVPKPC